jgi:hypothetical protein
MIQEALVAYHFGTTSESERNAVDAHLLGCTSCLRAYLRVKHHVERGAAGGARPSASVRDRIRADVATIVRPSGPARLHRLLRRPIPLYQGLAVAAVAAGVAIGLPSLLDGLTRKPPQTAARIDTSRAVAESLTIY